MLKSIPKYLAFLAIALVSSQCEVQPYKQGEILYNIFCANCHIEDGTGLGALIPPLAQADYVQADPLAMACIIRHGIAGEMVVNGVRYEGEMAGIEKLTEFEITNIINYINQAWGNDYGVVKLAEVRAALEACAPE